MAKRKKKNKPGAGRPTKKTKEVIEILLDCFNRGLNVKTACHLANIDEGTFCKWKQKDQNFATQINYAKATKVKQLHARVELDDPKFILKNMEPSLYRDKIDAELTGKDGESIEMVVRDYRE